MPLATRTVPRQRLHTRSIRYEGWLREDGLFDIEAAGPSGLYMSSNCQSQPCTAPKPTSPMYREAHQ